MRRVGVLPLLVLAALLTISEAAAAAPLTVKQVVFAGDVNPVSADFVIGEIRSAQAAHDAAVVLRIDTPGGDEVSMRRIVQAELNSTIPVIDWVAPAGARAASAGVFIMMASDLAAMAPETNIGSSTPIEATGQNIGGSDLRRKVINDAIASITSLAQAHHRNATWARDAVLVAANVAAPDAVAMHIVELIAPTLPDLLTAANGRVVVPKGLRLLTAGARVETVTMPLRLRLVETLLNPNLVFLLFFGGLALIAFEVAHPGVLLPGIAGGVMLVLSMIGLTVIPFTWAGLLLIAAGGAMIIAEAHIGHGAIGLVGVAALVAGALLLFDTPSAPGAVSVPLVIGVAVVLGGGLVFVVNRTSKARRFPVATGSEGLVGLHGLAREALAPRGWVFVHGELWQAEAPEPVPAGGEVVVDGVQGLVLHVRPAERGEL